MTNIRNDRRFSIARTDRPAAKIYRLPRRDPARAPGRTATLELRWSLDRAGRAVARWALTDEAVDRPAPRPAWFARLFRLAA